MECVGDTLDALCRRGESVPRLPHMRIYHADAKVSPYTQAWYKDYTIYEDVPSVPAVSKALHAQLRSDNIKLITTEEDWAAWHDAEPLQKACAAAVQRHTVAVAYSSHGSKSPARRRACILQDTRCHRLRVRCDSQRQGRICVTMETCLHTM